MGVRMKLLMLILPFMVMLILPFIAPFRVKSASETQA